MTTLDYRVIQNTNYCVIKNSYINTLLTQKREWKNSTENLLDFDELLPYLLIDFLIEYVCENTRSFPRTYEQFVKEISGDSRNDSSIKRNFNSFYQIKKSLDILAPSLLYVPPFLTYFCQSLTPNCLNRTEIFRNFNYTYFDADFYFHIIRDYNSIPFFKKDRYVSPKQYEKLIMFFSEISSKSLTDQWICQHFYDQYFSVLLFTQTLEFLNETIDNNTDRLSSFTDIPHIGEFLLLCTLIQNTSGIQTKKLLFDKVKKIFYINESFSSIWGQLAIELMIWNSIIIPYARHIYNQHLNTLLSNDENIHPCQKLYTQFRKIIENYDSTYIQHFFQTLKEDSCLPQKLFTSDYYTNTKVKKHVREERLKNYRLILNTFYNTAPLKLITDCSHMTSYSEIYKQASLDLELELFAKQAFMLK